MAKKKATSKPVVKKATVTRRTPAKMKSATKVQNETAQKQILILSNGDSITLLPNQIEVVEKNITEVKDLFSYWIAKNIVKILK